MAKTVKVFVACGSGVATSTIAADAIKSAAKEAGVAIELTKGTIAEVPAAQANADVIFTTANYRKPLDKPYLSVFGLISGVNAEAVKADVVRLLKEVAES